VEDHAVVRDLARTQLLLPGVEPHGDVRLPPAASLLLPALLLDPGDLLL
jgi:hypothetical protein